MKASVALRHAVTAILSTLALQSAVRAAQVLTYGADVGVGETDNVTLSSNDKVSQTIAVADLDFAVKQQTRRTDIDARGNFSYLDYLQGAFNNQFVGRFDGVGRFGLVPERLIWTVQDDFGQSTLDPFSPTTPSNLEQVNYFATGPDVNFRFGGTSFVDLSARYARTTYETSPFNSNRLLGTASWGLQLSARTSVSLHADTERVLFQDTVVNQDFTRTSVYGTYALQGARTTLTADLGATRVNQEGTPMNGGFALLDLERTLSRASKLILTAGHQLTDASTSFSGMTTGAGGVVGAAPAAQTSATYKTTYVSAGWRWERNRTAVALSGRWDKNQYDLFPQLDYTRSGAEGRVVRKLTHSLTAEIGGHVYKLKYPNAVLSGQVVAGGSNDYTDAGEEAAVTWRYGRGLEVRLRAEHTSRVATGLQNGYGESRAFLTVGYRPRPAEFSEIPVNENPAINGSAPINEGPGASAPGPSNQP